MENLKQIEKDIEVLMQEVLGLKNSATDSGNARRLAIVYTELEKVLAFVKYI